MKYEAISWEGALLGPETIDKLSDENAIRGQKAGDFGLSGKLRDEILSSWAEAKALWSLFQTRRAREDLKDQFGTSRTRQSWMIPFLALLGYELENAPAREVAGKSFAISHRDAKRLAPVHIVGFTESLDKKREGAAGSRGRASPHSLVQEYINLTDTLFALVTNGLSLRLLRDSSRLVKLSYLEFNLERIFEEDRYADFAVLFRLLHISRWPDSEENASECFLEEYHQDSLENGSRIREKLSDAVKNAIIFWADGLLNHPDNGAFRSAIATGSVDAREFYDALLTLVYRILFLLVIEERDLAHPAGATAEQKRIYRDFYSVSALRGRSRLMWADEGRYGDYWRTLMDVFSLFEDAERAEKLGLKPLAGDLFSFESFNLLRGLSMDNHSFSSGLNLLDSYEDELRHTIVRVNYAALNVEEFGSIYEGLLDFDADISRSADDYRFHFISGDDRGKSGSHYTPEELVQPLIEHALDPLIAKCLERDDAERALLDLKICDDACGSGHILLNAARRLALELSRLRTKADNPDPSSYRHALREVIERCIYGVDFNPQAVRLCKVALWLESHNPGESLGFLDHHIKCGDSLVGLARAEDLLEPIPEAAFAFRDGDDKDFASELRKRHKKELAEAGVNQALLDWRSKVGENLQDIIKTLEVISLMPDASPEEAALKKETYLHVTSGPSWLKLKALADVKLAPFFLPKKESVPLATESLYRAFLNGHEDLEGHAVPEAAAQIAGTRRFFHWFLEFAEVMQSGGFDCFLGNPPFLGGQKLSGSFGKSYLDYMKVAYAPARSIDLVGYFVRRNYSLLKDERALGTLATNTIAQGGTREGSLEVIEKQGGSIVMAVRSRRWPGAAAVEVSLAAIYKGQWQGLRKLDGKEVDFISTYFDDQTSMGNPYPLAENAEKSFQGSIVLGKGFVLEPEQAEALIARNPKNRDVLFPYLNGEDLNSRSDQSPSRWVINFFDWPLDHASAPADYEGPVAADYPDCLDIVERLVKPQRAKDNRAQYRKYWWQYAEKRGKLYRNIAPLERVMVINRHSKIVLFSFVHKGYIFSEATVVLAFSKTIAFSIINSAFHEFWAWKNSSTLGSGTLRFSPTDAFETFPFPSGFEPDRGLGDAAANGGDTAMRERLEELGKALDDRRREVMTRLDIGLTKLYNLYHTQELTAEEVVKAAKCPAEDAAWAIEKIIALRALHKTIDEAVRDAYGWQAIPLQHDFHELEFLPENDRVRYTISTSARKIILTELLKLNHARHAEEVAAGMVDEKGKLLKKKNGGGKKKKKEKTVDPAQKEMF